uniref:Piwi domain-containing protein n=1 Tax=Steinernema glaseri TaxID=37863 RepID=A0A1I7ZYD2_9BILA
MSAAANRELKSVFATIKDMAELADQGRFDPTITYIHIERNHQMRFKVDERLQMPRGFASSSNGNVPAGTVVEKVITSAKVYDFYLCSHYGALGTSRPTRYIVYFDDWMLTADQIQHASFCLCFLTSNCTKAVSIPAPAYYANKGCERGRKYINSCQLKREMLHPYEPLPIPNPVSTTMYMV